MKFCPKCGKQLDINPNNPKEYLCHDCKLIWKNSDLQEQYQVPYESPANNKYEYINPPAKKKKGGCLKAILIALGILILFFVFVIFVGIMERSDDENSQDNASSEIVEENDEPLEVEEQVLYEGHDVKIVLKSVEESALTTDFKIYIENDSDLNLGFNAHAYGVNGIMTGNNIYDMDTDVAAGKMANTVLSIDNSILSEYGSDHVEYVDVLFWAYDNDKMYKEFETDVVRFTSNYYDGEAEKITGTTIYDENGICVDFLTSDENGATYVLTNNRDEYVEFDVENITINDYTDSDWFLDLIGNTALSDYQYVFTIEPENEFLEMNEIDSISKIEFSLNIRSLGDYTKESTTALLKTDLK